MAEYQVDGVFCFPLSFAATSEIPERGTRTRNRMLVQKNLKKLHTLCQNFLVRDRKRKKHSRVAKFYTRMNTQWKQRVYGCLFFFFVLFIYFLLGITKAASPHSFTQTNVVFFFTISLTLLISLNVHSLQIFLSLSLTKKFHFKIIWPK